MSAKPDLEQTPTGDHLGQLADMRSMKDHSLHSNEILLVDTQDGVQLESERKAGSANKKDELSSLHQLLLGQNWPHCAYLHLIYPQQGLLRVYGLGQHNFFSRFTTSRDGWLAQTGQLFLEETPVHYGRLRHSRAVEGKTGIWVKVGFSGRHIRISVWVLRQKVTGIFLFEKMWPCLSFSGSPQKDRGGRVRRHCARDDIV